MKLARTIADSLTSLRTSLEGVAEIGTHHLAEAIQYRPRRQVQPSRCAADKEAGERIPEASSRQAVAHRACGARTAYRTVRLAQRSGDKKGWRKQYSTDRAGRFDFGHPQRMRSLESVSLKPVPSSGMNDRAVAREANGAAETRRGSRGDSVQPKTSGLTAVGHGGIE